jgi:hypothetical protein
MQRLSNKKVLAGNKQVQLSVSKDVSAHGFWDPLVGAQQTIGNHGLLRRQGEVVQAKLKIGAPSDKYEQEADRVAEAVMRMPERELMGPLEEEGEEERIQMKTVADQITPVVQRQVEENEGTEEEEEKGKPEGLIQRKRLSNQPPELTADVEARISALRGGGQPLPESTRAFFEPRFGYDFGWVRVHSSASVAWLTKALNAQALTTGRSIVFNVNRYDPGTTAGRRLLAHELTHVLQQRRHLKSPSFLVQRQEGRFPAMTVRAKRPARRMPGMIIKARPPSRKKLRVPLQRIPVTLKELVTERMEALVNQWQEAVLSELGDWQTRLAVSSLRERYERLSARVGAVELANATVSTEINTLLAFVGNIMWVIGGVASKFLFPHVSVLLQVAGALGGAASSLKFTNEGLIVNVEEFLKTRGPEDVQKRVKKYADEWIALAGARRRKKAVEVTNRLSKETPALLGQREKFRNLVFEEVFPGFGDAPHDLPIKTRKIVRHRLKEILWEFRYRARSEILRRETRKKTLKELTTLRIRQPEDPSARGVHPFYEGILLEELKSVMRLVGSAEAAYGAIKRLEGKQEQGGGAESLLFRKLQERLNDSSPKVRLNSVIVLRILTGKKKIKKSLAVAELIKVLGDSNEMVRAAAGAVLASLNATLAFPAIYEAKKRTKDEKMRSILIHSLKSLRNVILKT